MKRTITLIVILFFAGTAFAQQENATLTEKDTLLYLKYPSLPAFNIRLMDSFTVFNTFNIPKGRHALLCFFDPECKHCNDVARELMQGMDSLSNIDFYWFTPAQSMTAIREFYKRHGMDKYPNIKVMGRDYEFFFIDYYKVTSYPDFALYDDKKKFAGLFKGRVTVKELWQQTHK